MEGFKEGLELGISDGTEEGPVDTEGERLGSVEG